MQVSDINAGMTVFDSDGTELGQVMEAWAYTEGYGYIARKEYEIADYGPVGGTTTLMETDAGYFQVKQGHLLGVGGRDLYVPMSEVQSVVPEERVTLHSTREVCEERYGQPPTQK